MYRIRKGIKIIVGLSLVSVFVICLITFSKPSNLELVSPSRQHVVEAFKQQLAKKNKPLVADDTWHKRSINYDKGYNERNHDKVDRDEEKSEVRDVDLDVERQWDDNLERERERYFERGHKNNIGDRADDVVKEREQFVNVMRPIDSGNDRPHNTNNRRSDKELATISRSQQIVPGAMSKHSVPPVNEPRVYMHDSNSDRQNSKVVNYSASQQFERAHIRHRSLYQSSQFNRNPPTHLPASSHSVNSNPSVRFQPKLPMVVYHNNHHESDTNKYRANFPPRNVAIQPISHRNYSKVYNQYLLERKNKRLAELEEERRKKIATQNLLKKNCQGTKYCLAGMKSSQRWMHDECFFEALRDRNKSKIELNPCKCKLLKTTDAISKANVGLVSLAGSGNTWLRGLLEKATGVCTASMWCDSVLRAKDFCAEGLHSSLTLVTKNHDPTIRWRGQPIPKHCSDYNKPQFDAVIFLHRDPYEAMVAEWNRALAQYVRSASFHNKSVAFPIQDAVALSSDQHKAYFGEEAFGKCVFLH